VRPSIALLALAASLGTTLLHCNKPAPNTATEKGHQQLTESDRWSRRLKCRDLGSARETAAFAEQRDSARRDPKDQYIVLRAEYCYNETLNTCIFEQGIIGSGYQSLEVIDVITGRVLESDTAALKTPSDDERRKTLEYKQRRDALFDGCAK